MDPHRRPAPLPTGPGQESVWSYPRPPRLEPEPRRVTVWLGGEVVADTTAALRVLETSHPPTYYLPPAAIAPGALRPAQGASVCEWKGRARFWTVAAGGERREAAAWSYPSPTAAFADLADHVAFYCSSMHRCEVGGEAAAPQPGGFYGGWVTSWVVGPFKGGPGSWGW
ncbi:MAG TPA: DUF427 domain-containing protein [Acidimicrobiales bacterium]|nr:DUF427 domain-containing protein [Acidimicrobiales bacterium]